MNKSKPITFAPTLKLDGIGLDDGGMACGPNGCKPRTATPTPVRHRTPHKPSPYLFLIPFGVLAVYVVMAAIV